MATNSNTIKKAERCPSQMAKELYLREGQSNKMKRLESELDNIAWMTYSVKEDSVGLDMWYEWITSAYLDRSCTGRFQGSRGFQVVRVQTGGAPSEGLVKDMNHLGGSRGGIAQNRSEWRQSVAQCIHLDAG